MRYFFDSFKDQLIAVDTESKEIYVLESLSNLEGEPSKETKNTKVEKKEKSSKRRCSYCDELGHTAATCPKKRVAERSRKDAEDETRALTERQFDDVKDAKADGLTSLEIANEMNVPIAEVNRAFSAVDYDYYFEHR